MKYYFSYGMNTNIEEMARRCPKAKCLGRVLLSNYKFVFRYHADIEPCNNKEVIGVLWQITSQCEQALDSLEGYPYYYGKQEVIVKTRDGENINGMTHFNAMVYSMNNQTTTDNPKKSYYNCLIDGYTANKISTNQIGRAHV